MIIALNNIHLFYQKKGSGPPIILLHGNGEDHQIFAPLQTKLAEKFTVYALDSRNHGASQSTNDYSYQTMKNDLRAFIHSLSLAPVHLIGFSDGAITALLLAIEQPEWIDKMALLGLNLKPNDFKPDYLAAAQKEYTETKSPLIHLMLTEPWIELTDLTKVTNQTLLVWATDDVFDPQLPQQVVEHLPYANLMLLENQSHDSYLVNNDLLAPDLLKFFS